MQSSWCCDPSAMWETCCEGDKHSHRTTNPPWDKLDGLVKGARSVTLCSPCAAGLPVPGLAPNTSQQATRHARRVYVGGLPPTANEQSIATFFSHALAAVGGNTAGPGEGQWGMNVWGGGNSGQGGRGGRGLLHWAQLLATFVQRVVQAADSCAEFPSAVQLAAC